MLRANKVLLATSAQPEASRQLQLDVTYAAAPEDLGSTCDETYRALARPPSTQEALVRLASGTSPYSGSATTAHTRALRAMVDRAIVRRVAHGRYAFAEPMFAECLRRTRE